MSDAKTVEIPYNMGKKIVLQQPTGRSYKYVTMEIDRYYNKIKTFTVPKRVTIGRVCSDNPELMIPNDNYLKYFPDQPIPEKEGHVDHSCCMKIGTFVVFQDLSYKLNLQGILEKYFGKNDAATILDLALFYIIEEDNAAQHFSSYAFGHPLFSEGMNIISDSTISRFLSKDSTNNVQNFLNEWTSQHNNQDYIYISYDATNKNSQAGDVSYVELGKAKDAPDLPVFNVGISYDISNSTPLFYMTYPGSINDVAQTKCLVEAAKAYGFTKCRLILDRGNFSQDNIKYMDESDIGFLMMVKGCKPLVSSLIEEHKGSFEDECDTAMEHNGLHGKTIKHPLFENDKKERYFHLFYSPQKASDERINLENNLSEIEHILQKFLEKFKGKKQSPTIPANYVKFFKMKLDEKQNLISFEKNCDEVKRALRLCGYFTIISNYECNAKEAYNTYIKRDSSEKLFATDKTFLGSKCMRVHSNMAVNTKLFVEFIALILRTAFYISLLDKKKEMHKRPNFMSVPAAIDELEKIELCRQCKGIYRLDHAITKNQRKILSAFDFSPDDVRTQATQISQILQENYKEHEPNPEQEIEQEYEDSLEKQFDLLNKINPHDVY